ncbi:MAG: Crp/Fnr family transcriptional regulator [Thermodesulfobacteriota bacterium]
MEKTLENSLMFKSFSKDQIKKIVKISSVHKYSAKQIIFFDNDPAEGLYLVKTGRVKIFKMSEEGKEQVLHIFSEGEPFGEVAVFSSTNFPANSEAVEDSEIIYIPKTGLLKIFKEDPSTAMNILAVLSIRLKQFTKLIEDLTLKELPERLAAYILQQDDIQGSSGKIILEFSKGQLSKILGSTQESLSRTLTKLSKGNIIEIDKREIKIIERQLLEDIAEGTENIKNINI